MKPRESLINLFGYLHEDWADDYDSAWSAVTAFAEDEPLYAPAVRSDIDAVLHQFTSEDELRTALLGLGLAYRPAADGWGSHRAWLTAVADGIDRVRHGLPVTE